MEFVKLYSHMLESSLWEENSDTRIVWVTLLLKMDPAGYVKCASVERLAALANVSFEACQEAIRKFLSPDTISPGQDHEGRRIETVVGGWRVLNGPKYLLTAQREAWREAKRRERARKNGPHLKTTGTTAERLDTKP